MLEKSKMLALLGLALLMGNRTWTSRPAAPEFDQQMVAGALRWRSIGPFRGGRAKAITGIPGAPNVFYIGAVNGGIWKTTHFGRTWLPLFYDHPPRSLG